MIGRKSTLQIAGLAAEIFSRSRSGTRDLWGPSEPVYDFFYANDFEATICNHAKHAAGTGHRNFVEFILRFHTGESVSVVGGIGHPAALAAQGQVHLRHLALALLQQSQRMDEALAASALARELARFDNKPNRSEALLRSLELDGYVFRDDKLLHVDSALIDVEKQHSALLHLAKDLQLANLEAMSKFLDLSEEHYSASRWEDCIGNSRKFLEASLQESAAVFSQHKLGTPIPLATYEKPVKIREFLQANRLLAEKEAKAIAETYGLLSQTGSHPKMAASDHARVLRQVALLYSEFVLLKTKDALK